LFFDESNLKAMFFVNEDNEKRILNQSTLDKKKLNYLNDVMKIK